MALYVGTSGWAYREWKPDFYPQGLPQSRFLNHYADVLNACEINATFYRIQTAATFQRWADATPEHFRFSTKAHRRLTHSRFLPIDENGRRFLKEFLDSVAPLGSRLGVLLFQFPPHRQRDDSSFERLLVALPPSRRYAFEFRHPSWNDPEVTEMVGASGATICLAETEGKVPEQLPPGPLAYVRLRFDAYSEGAREAWKRLLTTEAQDRDVFAFTKHEGVPAGDPFSGIGLAEWLSRRDPENLSLSVPLIGGQHVTGEIQRQRNRAYSAERAEDQQQERTAHDGPGDGGKPRHHGPQRDDGHEIPETL